MKNILIFILLFSFQNGKILTPEQLYNIQRRMLIYRIVEDNFTDDRALPNKGEYLDLEIEKATLDGTPKDWKLIKVYNEDYKFRSKQYNSQKLPNDRIFYKLSRLNLIALDSNDEIIYISGCFYTYRISSKFNLIIDNPSSFHNYIKHKLYNYGLWDIKFLKKNKQFIEFKAFSGILNSKVIIKIDKNNFDKIEIIKLSHRHQKFIVK